MISMLSKGLSRVFSSTTGQKHQFFSTQLSSQSNSQWAFVGKVMSLLFNMLSRFVVFFSKEQASFNLMAAVSVHSDFGAREQPRDKSVCLQQYRSMEAATPHESLSQERKVPM